MITCAGRDITFSKTLWSEDELELAMCLGFTHHVDTNVVSCDITVTAPLAVLEFVKKVLPEWAPGLNGSKPEHQEVWEQIRHAYSFLFQARTEAFKKKIPYWQKFYKHQKQTLLESIDRDHNLWAIEQRMGKTITALTLSMLRDDKCTVFVTLNTPKWSIPKEVSKEFGLDRMQFSVLDSAESRTIRAFLIEKVIFINYEAVGKYKNYLLERKPTHWILDECVKIKNTHTSLFKNISSIISTLKEQGVNPKITMLSGMPIRNRVNDLFAYFKLVGHHLGKNYAKFMRDFTHTSAAFGGQKVKGGKNLDELFVKMSNFMIRKTRAECMDVPKKITKNLYFEMGDYKAEFEKALEELAQTRNVMDIEKYIHTLNIITSKSKITGIIDVAESLIEAGKKIVIFSSYNEPLRLLEEYFKERCVKVTGAVVDPREREHLRTRFWEEEKIEVFLGNRMACSMGIDLSCASDVIHCDYPLVPDEIEQANARVDHMKKNKEINIYHSFAEGSLDEDLLALISSKAKDINAVINRDNKGQLNYENIPQELYKKMLERLSVKTETKQQLQ